MAASTCINSAKLVDGVVRISRRGLLTLPMQLMTPRPVGATETGYESLEYRAGRLRWPGGSAPAAVGRSGVRAKANKKEGDGATPTGIYQLVFGFYREDRIKPPPSRLPMRALAPYDAWVDDPTDARYNSLVTLPYPARTERMWRNDGIYDVMIVIGYNMEPVIPGAGSAIFLHMARPNFSATEGCIAVDQAVLVNLIPLLAPESSITIAV
jgi:L,D-peptidoglycan transpeptidase YkuD (ErfK/YbiS/YcfS/YnhG family)